MKPIKSAFKKENERRHRGECPFCGIEITETSFKDALSKKEFSISGLCQRCQDEVFGEE